MIFEKSCSFVWWVEENVLNLQPNVMNSQSRILKLVYMEIAINRKVYQQAQMYAQGQGLNLGSVIENFLVQLISRNKNSVEKETVTPDAVMSLLGAGDSVSTDDLNGREAYYHYLEEKHR